jgi:hypothetical protein
MGQGAYAPHPAAELFMALYNRPTSLQLIGNESQENQKAEFFN